MKGYLLFILVMFILVTACRKDEPYPIINSQPIQDWEKFIGEYNVYDTNGIYMYNLEISLYRSDTLWNGQIIDSIELRNFADTFDLKVHFANKTDPSVFDIGIHHPVIDKNGKRWHLSHLADDASTTRQENALVNDTLVFYFQQSNIAFYIADAVPYFACNCKHVAVKQ